jgi:hypothetical protein
MYIQAANKFFEKKHNATLYKLSVYSPTEKAQHTYVSAAEVFSIVLVLIGRR